MLHFSPFLKTGTICAIFQSDGRDPVLNDILNRSDNGSERFHAQFFNIFPCMPSGPGALLAFTFLSIDYTNSLDTLISEKLPGQSKFIFIL